VSVFSNLTLQLSFNQINSTNFSAACGFAKFTPSNSYYYVSDWNLNKIFILTESWSFVSSKDFFKPVYFTTIGSSLYVVGQTNIWKLDQYLNILIQYNATGTAPVYLGIYYNSTNNFIYTTPITFSAIHVFNLTLSFNHQFSISPYKPYSITDYNNQIYVGTTIGTILVIENEMILQTFNGCNGNSVWLTYILFDNCGLMATSCKTINHLYLYYPNGTYVGKNLTAPTEPRYMGYDSNGEFVQISYPQISIYN
jgi:hypothetical protein